MTREIRREVGERLAAELPNLDYGPNQFVCGCFPEDIQQHDGVWWAYTKLYGFHSPFEQHPPDEVAAARLFLADGGDGVNLA